MKRHPLLLLLSAALSALLAVAGALVFALAASALPVIGHGVGHLWAVDGRSWLGSHRLSDGNLGLCLQVELAPPEGSDVTYVNAGPLGWYSADDAARLAYVGRWWANSKDADWAASAQLAAWTVTGLGGHTQEWFARRANGSGAVVLIRARQMREAMDARGGASRGVTARISLAVPTDAGGTVSSDLVVDYIGGGPTPLAPDSHRGTLTLTGARFDDGSTVRSVLNGQTLSITPTSGTALSDVTADVVYTDLPYGKDVYVAKAPRGIQSLLVPPPGGIEARAHAHAGDVSPLSFSPKVQTQTSAAVSMVGAHLFDTLELGVVVKQPKVVAGGVAGADAPSGDSAEASAAMDIPSGAGATPGDSATPGDEPVTAGTGTASARPGVTPQGAGVPAAEGDATPQEARDTPATAGAVSFEASVGGEAEGEPSGESELAGLTEWGVYRDDHGALQPVPVTVRSTLWGPFSTAPAPGATAPLGSPSVCIVVTHAQNGPGRYETPDCTLPAAGFYVWIETIDPADTPVEKGGGRFTPWASTFGAATEVTLAELPPPPPPSPTPTPTPTPTGSETPPPTPPAPTTPSAAFVPPALPPAASQPQTPLASTGLNIDLTVVAGASALSLIGLLCVVLRTRRRAHPRHLRTSARR